jgi:hypothetical protein
MNGESLIKFLLFVVLGSIVINFFNYTSHTATTTQYKQFCEIYLKYVNKYPKYLDAWDCVNL